MTCICRLIEYNGCRWIKIIVHNGWIVASSGIHNSRLVSFETCQLGILASQCRYSYRDSDSVSFASKNQLRY